MLTFVKLLTTFAVALHAMLGCCAHHSHACSTHNHICGSHAQSDCSKPVDSKPKRCGHSGSQKQGCAHGHGPEIKTSAPTAQSGKCSSQCLCCNSGESNHPNHGDCDELNCSFASTERVPDMERVIASDRDLFQHSAVAGSQSFNGCDPDNLDMPPIPPDLNASGLSLRAQLQVWRL